MDNYNPLSIRQYISPHCTFCGAPLAQVTVRITHPTLTQGLLGEYTFCDSCASKLITYIESQKSRPVSMNSTGRI